MRRHARAVTQPVLHSYCSCIYIVFHPYVQKVDRFRLANSACRQTLDAFEAVRRCAGRQTAFRFRRAARVSSGGFLSFQRFELASNRSLPSNDLSVASLMAQLCSNRFMRGKFDARRNHTCFASEGTRWLASSHPGLTVSAARKLASKVGYADLAGFYFKSANDCFRRSGQLGASFAVGLMFRDNKSTRWGYVPAGG